jgi:tRNA U34 2-thiouridine synthase MnmA/TrmU
MNQGIDVVAVFFETPFFESTRAFQSAENIGVPFKVVDLTKDHLPIVKNPKHGHGENMNPCIDCHMLMIRKAGEMMKGEGADFLITGEVLGQRPMSQNKRALALVAEGSGYNGFLLRPLSAKRLPQTVPVQKGWVDGEKLMGFSGRSRKPQMALAKSLGIETYPSPAGGCLLTDQVFSRRLRDLFEQQSDPDVSEIELLKTGRHFRIGPDAKVVVGRNKKENQRIRSLKNENSTLLSTIDVPGPTVLVSGKVEGEAEDLVLTIVASYSDAENGRPIEIRVEGKGSERILKGAGREKDAFKKYMI